MPPGPENHDNEDGQNPDTAILLPLPQVGVSVTLSLITRGSDTKLHV